LIGLFFVKGIIFKVLTIDDRTEVEEVLRFDFFASSTVFILPIPSALCGLLKVCRTNKYFIYTGTDSGCQ
jgi:hypothetical protein